MQVTLPAAPLRRPRYPYVGVARLQRQEVGVEILLDLAVSWCVAAAACPRALSTKERVVARTVKSERRYLSTEELELVAKTHHPAIAGLPDQDLAALVKLVRERRDRARGIASRQRRELRRKAAPAGARPAADDTGTRRKSDVLAAALKRLNRESERRRVKAAREAMRGNAHRALSMRRAAAGQHHPATGQTAGAGMRPKTRTKADKTTSPAKVGSVSQAGKVAQARRDSR